MYSSELMKTYYFDGCLTKFKDQVVDNKEVIIWVAIATLMILVRKAKYNVIRISVVGMFLLQVVTLLVTLAMCMRA